MSPAFSSFAAFLNMGGYAVYVWLAVAVTVAAFALLMVHTLWARRALFHEVRRQQARERRIAAANMTRRPRMQARRKIRLYIVLAVLAGLGLTVSLTLYALSSNIDLFYTPGEIIYGKTETRALPHTGQRLRVGGYVQPGSLQRDPQTLDVRFKLYDARGVVDVSYKGILPDLFREGQGVVAQGVLDGERHITAQQVLAKHDENYTPPEVKNAMTPEKTGTQP